MVSRLEIGLKKDAIRIKSLELDLEKELALGSYHEKQAKIKAEEINQNVNDIYFKIENDHVKRIKEIKNEIDELKLEEERLKDDFQIAYNQKNNIK